MLKIMALEHQVNLVLQYRIDEYQMHLSLKGQDSGRHLSSRTPSQHVWQKAP